MRIVRILTIAATFLIGACSGGEEGAGNTVATIPPPVATANDIHATSRDQLRDGGTLTWPIDLFPPNFNFNQIDGTEQNHYWVNRALMPRTFRADASGTPRWDPDFLASEPVLT